MLSSTCVGIRPDDDDDGDDDGDDKPSHLHQLDIPLLLEDKQFYALK